MTRTQKFLLLAVLGLIPIALMYGLVPSITLPFLFDIDASPINVSHIFRAVMGLYLALAVLLAYGGFRDAANGAFCTTKSDCVYVGAGFRSCY